MTTRREVLKAMAAGAATLTLWPRLAWSATSGSSQPLLLVVMLRGGLDGLHAVPPIGDSAWGALRGSFAFAPADAANSKPIPLDRNFALHPALTYASELYQRKQFMPVVAIAPPYRNRSHFDAQDCLENGTIRPRGALDGWMNRCVSAMRGDNGMAIANAMPLIMRGPARISSWSPPLPVGADPALMHRLDTLYAEDKQLAEAFQLAVAESASGVEPLTDSSQTDMKRMAGATSAGMPVNAGKGLGGRAALPGLMAAAGRFMAKPDGPQLTFVEDTGWDTHSNETATLNIKLAQLDAGLRSLHDALGDPAWSRTVVAVVTEFGRTARPNGTGGTDHGVGGTAFLAGGAITGGRVAGRWPGMSPQDLNDNRDLQATTDMRALFKGLLASHLQVPQSILDRAVFPDSAAIRPMEGLVRGIHAVAA